MSESAHVKSVQAIEEFKTDLKRFGHETEQLLQDVSRKIVQTQQWLGERERYWQYQIELCQEMVRQTRRALEHCLSDDDRRDCSAYEDGLHQAYCYLRKAEEELQNVRLWKGRVGQAISDYQRQAYRLGSQLTNDVPKAGAFLEKVIVKLQAYVNVSVHSGEGKNGEILTQHPDSINYKQDHITDIIRIPFGFRNQPEFENFGKILYDRFSKAGFDDVIAIVQGSAATGISYEEKKPFDKNSDFDIAIASPSLFDLVSQAGLKIRGKNNQPRILIDAKTHYVLKKFDLADIGGELSGKAGRKVNFMIYKSESDAIKRAEISAIEIGIPKEFANILIPK